jgi:hypothetical protein
MNNQPIKWEEEFDNMWYNLPMSSIETNYKMANQLTIDKFDIKQFISNLLTKREKEIVEEIESKLPEEKEIAINLPDTLHRNTGYNDCLSEVKQILNHTK